MNLDIEKEILSITKQLIELLCPDLFSFSSSRREVSKSLYGSPGFRVSEDSR
jgi:hypothetical protein